MKENRKKEIRISADKFREKCKVSRYGIIDLFKECERYGFKLLRYPLGNDAELGFALRKDSDTIIFTNTCIRLSRELFTLAHEIGHSILHLQSVPSFIDNVNTLFGRSTDEVEQEANYFAACLLMPEDEVNKFFDLEIDNWRYNDLSAMDIARIMSEFNVSFDMVLNRLESLEKINGMQKIRIDNERNIMRVGNLLKSVGGNSRLNEAAQEIDIPYEYIDYVIYNYNHNAIPIETLQRALKYCRLTIDDVRDKLVQCKDKECSQDNEDLDELIGGLED